MAIMRCATIGILLLLTFAGAIPHQNAQHKHRLNANEQNDEAALLADKVPHKYHTNLTTKDPVTENANDAQVVLSTQALGNATITTIGNLPDDQDTAESETDSMIIAPSNNETDKKSYTRLHALDAYTTNPASTDVIAGTLEKEASGKALTLICTGGSTVTVDSAFYGRESCGLSDAEASKGALTDLQTRCNGEATCTYTVNHLTIGDPAPGCAKDYTYSYHCTGSADPGWVPSYPGSIPSSVNTEQALIIEQKYAYIPAVTQTASPVSPDAVSSCECHICGTGSFWNFPPVGQTCSKSRGTCSASRECYRSGSPADYRGYVSTTISGHTCQHWTAQQPHEHSQRLGSHGLPEGNQTHNYCRDPDNTGYPWCYTTNSGKRWEGCGISACDASNADGCYFTGTGNLGDDLCLCQACKECLPPEPCACMTCAGEPSGDAECTTKELACPALDDWHCEVSLWKDSSKVEIMRFYASEKRVYDMATTPSSWYEGVIEKIKARSVPADSNACERVIVYDEDEGCGVLEDSMTYKDNFDWTKLPHDLYHDSSCFDVVVRPDPSLKAPRRGAVHEGSYFVGTPTHVDELGTPWCLPRISDGGLSKAPRGCVCQECGSALPLPANSTLRECRTATSTCSADSTWSESNCFFTGTANDVSSDGTAVCTCSEPQCICKKPGQEGTCMDCDICDPAQPGDLDLQYCRVTLRYKNKPDELMEFSTTTTRVMEGLSDSSYEDAIESFKAESVPANSNACERVIVYDEDVGCGNSEDSMTYKDDFGWKTLPHDLKHDSSCFDVIVRPNKPGCIFTGLANTASGKCQCKKGCEVILLDDDGSSGAYTYFTSGAPDDTAKDAITNSPFRFSDETKAKDSTIQIQPGAGCFEVVVGDEDYNCQNKSESDNAYLADGMFADLKRDCKDDWRQGEGGSFCCKNNNGNCDHDLNEDVCGLWVTPKGTRSFMPPPPSPSSVGTHTTPDGVPPLFALGRAGTDECPANYTHVVDHSMCQSALSDHQNAFGWNKCGAQASWNGAVTNWADGISSVYDIIWSYGDLRPGCKGVSTEEGKVNKCGEATQIKKKDPSAEYDSQLPTGCYLDQDSVKYPKGGKDAPSMKVRFNPMPDGGTIRSRAIQGEHAPICIAVGWDYVIPTKQQCELTLLDDMGKVISSRLYDQGEYSIILTAESDEENDIKFIDVGPNCAEVILGDADGNCAKVGDNSQWPNSMCNGCTDWNHEDNERVQPTSPGGYLYKIDSADLRHDVCGMYVRHKKIDAFTDVTTDMLGTPCQCHVCGSVRGAPYASTLPTPFDGWGSASFETCGAPVPGTCNAAHSPEADALDWLVKKCDDNAEWGNSRLFNKGHVESVTVNCGFANGTISRADESAPRQGKPWDRYAGSVCVPTVKSGCYFTGEPNMPGNQCNCTADPATFSSGDNYIHMPATCDTSQKIGPLTVSCVEECDTKCSERGPALSSCYGTLYKGETQQCWLVTDSRCVAGGSAVSAAEEGEPTMRQRPKPEDTCWNSNLAPPHCCSNTDEAYNQGVAPLYESAKCWDSDRNSWKKVYWEVFKMVLRVGLALLTAGISAEIQAAYSLGKAAMVAVKLAVRTAMVGVKMGLAAGVAGVQGKDPLHAALAKAKTESIRLLKNTFMDFPLGKDGFDLSLPARMVTPNGGITRPLRSATSSLVAFAALGGMDAAGRVSQPSLSWHKTASMLVQETMPSDFYLNASDTTCSEIHSWTGTVANIGKCRELCDTSPLMVYVRSGGGKGNCGCLSSCTKIADSASNLYKYVPASGPPSHPPGVCVEASNTTHCGEGYGSCASLDRPCCSKFGYCHMEGIESCGAQAQTSYNYCKPSVGEARVPVPEVSLIGVPVFWLLWRMIDGGAIPPNTDALVAAKKDVQCLSDVPEASEELQTLCCEVPGIAAEERCTQFDCNSLKRTD